VSGIEGTQRRLAAGRYRLVRELGRGGMSTVWLAADELLGRMVAMKELRPESGLTDEDVHIHEQRALQEARSAARIQHPNAVTLYEVIPAETARGPIYLVMEFVEGHTLGELIARDGPLPAGSVAGYGLEVLDALGAAHALGIVHRDVKPENIMITADGHAKLSDFGIAHTVGDPRVTGTGIVLGTQAYIAPELFNGGTVTPAVDLWSLGATLYHAAEGHGPFNRDSAAATLHAILLDEVPVPRCDPGLAAALTGLLRRDPHERATIEQARASLRQIPTQWPVSQPASQLPRPNPPADLNPSWDAQTSQQPQTALQLPLPAEKRARRLFGSRRADLQPGWDASTGLQPPTGLEIPLPRRREFRTLGNRHVAIAAVAVLLLAGGVVGGVLATRAPAGRQGPSSLTLAAPARSARPSKAATSSRSIPSLASPSPVSAGEAPAGGSSAASGAPPASGHSASSSPAPATVTYFTIKNEAHDLCLNAMNHVNTAQVDVANCNSSWYQDWRFAKEGAGDEVVNEESGLCLTTKSVASGGDVVIETCAGSSAQVWNTHGATVDLAAKPSSLCLSADSPATNESPAGIATCASNIEQEWTW
jgi:eukaryotic-like serine/threonine-protein kinase